MQSIYKQSEFEETEEVSLGDLFYKYLPYWPFFLLLVLLVLTGAWIYLRYKMPVYQTTATLLIKDDKKGPRRLLNTWRLLICLALKRMWKMKWKY